MNRRTWLTTIATFSTGILLLPPLVLLFIPDATVQQAVTRLLGTKEITVQATRITTSLPFGVTATKLSLADSNTTWVTLDRASLQLRLLPLLIGRISIGVSGAVGTGELAGTLNLWPKTKSSIQITQLELDSVPLLAAATGGIIKGTAQLDLALQDSKQQNLNGEMRLLIRNVQMKGVRISNMPLPDVTFPELRGLLTIKGQTVNINNLALQGNGIYLRLSGTAALTPGSPLNLTLELLPSAAFLEQQKSIFLLMFPYQTSPGSYRLPIAGTLANPQLAGR